jgi:hypothetical protein
VPLSALTIYGSRVYPVFNGSEPSSKFFTLGCLFKVKSDLYGLTAAHIFKAQMNDVSAGNDHMPKAENISSDRWHTSVETTEDKDDDIIINYDEDYNLSSDNEIDIEKADDKTSLLIASYSGDGKKYLEIRSTAKKIESSTVESIAIISDNDDCISDKSDLNWAALKIEDPY